MGIAESSDGQSSSHRLVGSAGQCTRLGLELILLLGITTTSVYVYRYNDHREKNASRPNVRTIDVLHSHDYGGT